MILRYLYVLLYLLIGLGYHTVKIHASEPSIYSKMLVPSPLGKDRILIVCSPVGIQDQTLKKFYHGILWDEFSERHLTIVEVSKNSVASIAVDDDSSPHGKISKVGHHNYGDGLRKRANCSDKLKFVLIGKDTGVKAQWDEELIQQDLFDRIDAMPMRRYEMLQKAEIE